MTAKKEVANKIAQKKETPLETSKRLVPNRVLKIMDSNRVLRTALNSKSYGFTVEQLEGIREKLIGWFQETDKAIEKRIAKINGTTSESGSSELDELRNLFS